MRRLDGEIWLEFEELTGKKGCGISENTVRHGIMDGSCKWQAIVDPADRRKRLVRYSTLADKYKDVVRRCLCGGLEPEEWMELRASASLSQWEPEETIIDKMERVLDEEYKRYLYLYSEAGGATSASMRAQDKASERLRRLARSAGAVEVLVTWYDENELSWREYGPINEVSEWLKAKASRQDAFGYLPVHPLRLKEKVMKRAQGAEIQEVIYLPRAENKNSEVYSSDKELLGWVYQLGSMGYNFSGLAIARKVQLLCQITSKPVPSIEWLSKIMASPEYKRLVAQGRYGKDHRRAGFYKGYVPIKGAVFAGDCWEIDGTRVNMIGHASADRTLRPLYIVTVRDVMSGDVLGVSYGYAEDRWTVTMALRMAVECTGYLPYELRHDRFPGHQTQEWESLVGKLEAYGTKVTVVHSATGKARLERWFGTLQTVFLSETQYYYGEGVKSTRPYNFREEGLLVQMHKDAKADGWNFSKAWKQAQDCVEAYRQTPLCWYSRKHQTLDKSPMQLHEESEKPHVVRLESYQMAELFWWTKTLGIRHNMLQLTVQKEEYLYPIFDRNLLNRYKEVRICYSEGDMSELMLFDPITNDFLGTVQEQKRLSLLGPDADFGQLQQLKSRYKALSDADADALSGYADAVETAIDPGVVLLMGGRLKKGVVESAESQYLDSVMPGREEVLAKSSVGKPQRRLPKASKSSERITAKTPTATVPVLSDAEMTLQVLSEM